MQRHQDSAVRLEGIVNDQRIQFERELQRRLDEAAQMLNSKVSTYSQ